MRFILRSHAGNRGALRKTASLHIHIMKGVSGSNKVFNLHTGSYQYLSKGRGIGVDKTGDGRPRNDKNSIQVSNVAFSCTSTHHKLRCFRGSSV